MATPILLCRTLKTFIEKTLADNATATPSVFLGQTPNRTKETAGTSEFPFVIVRPVKGKVEQLEHFSIVKLIFGCKADEDDGFMDALNVMERVRVALMRKRVVGNQFQMEFPLEWELFEEQPFPDWFAQITTKWTLPGVREEVEGI